VTAALRAAYVVPYLEMVNRLPELWGYLYKASADKKVDSKTSRFRSIATKLQSRPLKRLISRFAPDHILATHFIPLDALTTRGGRGKIDVPVTTVITDYAVHSFWLRSWVDRYFVASEECAAVLARRGFDPEKIQVTGVPTDPIFADEAARAEAVAAAGRGRRLRVLLMAGGFGVGPMVEAAKAILGIRGAASAGGRHVHLTAIAGRNEDVKRELEALAVPSGAELTVRGFVTDVHQEMAKAHVLVSKAGGLTVTEALVMGLPMFLLAPTPGQEEHNADMLLEEGAAKKVSSLDALEYKLDRALAAPAWLGRMRERARAIRRPNAAREIVEAASAMGGSTAEAKKTPPGLERRGGAARAPPR